MRSEKSSNDKAQIDKTSSNIKAQMDKRLAFGF